MTHHNNGKLGDNSGISFPSKGVNKYFAESRQRFFTSFLPRASASSTIQNTCKVGLEHAQKCARVHHVGHVFGRGQNSIGGKREPGSRRPGSGFLTKKRWQRPRLLLCERSRTLEVAHKVILPSKFGAGYRQNARQLCVLSTILRSTCFAESLLRRPLGRRVRVCVHTLFKTRV